MNWVCRSECEETSSVVSTRTGGSEIGLSLWRIEPCYLQKFFRSIIYIAQWTSLSWIHCNVVRVYYQSAVWLFNHKSLVCWSGAMHAVFSPAFLLGRYYVPHRVNTWQRPNTVLLHTRLLLCHTESFASSFRRYFKGAASHQPKWCKQQTLLRK